jgi:hypothetical protein
LKRSKKKKKKKKRKTTKKTNMTTTTTAEDEKPEVVAEIAVHGLAVVCRGPLYFELRDQIAWRTVSRHSSRASAVRAMWRLGHEVRPDAKARKRAKT